jgi:hypothetical protein
MVEFAEPLLMLQPSKSFKTAIIHRFPHRQMLKD